MKKMIWICPRCGGKNRLRFATCRRCRARVPAARRIEMALLWAQAPRLFDSEGPYSVAP